MNSILDTFSLILECLVAGTKKIAELGSFMARFYLKIVMWTALVAFVVTFAGGAAGVALDYKWLIASSGIFGLASFFALGLVGSVIVALIEAAFPSEEDDGTTPPPQSRLVWVSPAHWLKTVRGVGSDINRGAQEGTKKYFGYVRIALFGLGLLFSFLFLFPTGTNKENTLGFMLVGMTLALSLAYTGFVAHLVQLALAGGLAKIALNILFPSLVPTAFIAAGATRDTLDAGMVEGKAAKMWHFFNGHIGDPAMTFALVVLGLLFLMALRTWWIHQNRNRVAVAAAAAGNGHATAAHDAHATHGGGMKMWYIFGGIIALLFIGWLAMELQEKIFAQGVSYRTAVATEATARFDRVEAVLATGTAVPLILNDETTAPVTLTNGPTLWSRSIVRSNEYTVLDFEVPVEKARYVEMWQDGVRSAFGGIVRGKEFKFRSTSDEPIDVKVTRTIRVPPPIE